MFRGRGFIIVAFRGLGFITGLRVVFTGFGFRI